MYEILKDKLENTGELMIELDSGKEAELHLHNTEFVENNLIKVDADDEIHWFEADKVERFWIHKDF